MVAGDALGNFHFTISLWPALLVAAFALGAMLSSRSTLGLVCSYLAIALAANAAVANVLAPPHSEHSIANMVEGSRVTIEGSVYREIEREAYGDRLYVKVERAAEQSEPMSPSVGNVRVAVLGGGIFSLGDEIRLSARIHFPRNYGNPGEFDYVSLMARDGIDATMTASEELARFAKISNHRASFAFPREPD